MHIPLSFILHCPFFCLQLTLHHLYSVRLGGREYPFPLKQWFGYPMAFCVMLAVVYLLPEIWVVRWSLGAILGIFEILRIMQRRVLICVSAVGGVSPTALLVLAIR